MIRLTHRHPARLSIDEVRDALQRERPGLVLVDCFGTLLHRVVPTSRVRELAAIDLAAVLAIGDQAHTIATMRREIERQLARSLSPSGEPVDHRLPELARGLHDRLPAVARLDVEEFSDLFCRVELATEASLTLPNHALADVLGNLATPRRVCVLSDTNLSEGMMRELLVAHDLEGIAERIVVSSDAGVTKRSGRLYAVAVDRHAAGSGVVMIGDDDRSDRLRAQEAGIQSFLIRGGRWDASRHAAPRLLQRDAAARLRDVLRPVDDQDVFPEMALTLWLFTARLDDALRTAGATRAVFLAREGAFLKALFDRYQRDVGRRARAPIASSYLLTSRKSTFLPALRDPATGLQQHLSTYQDTSRRDLARLLSMEVPGQEAQPQCRLTASELDSMLACPSFVAAIEERRNEQADLLRQLVDDAAPEPGPLHTVDVGWKGTVRDHLAAVLAPRPVHAHLVGLILRTTDGGDRRTTGHLFSNRPQRSEQFQVYAQFKELYELLLAAPEGSVASYVRHPDRGVVALTDDNEDERHVHEAFVGDFQRRGMARVDELTRVLSTERLNSSWLPQAVAAHHARMIYRPRETELDFVEELAQHENFGRPASRVSGDGSPAASDRSLIRRHIGGGGWPPLRMRRAGADWQRRPYGALKSWQVRRGRAQ